VSEDAEILQAFVEESRENLDALDRDLVVLETRPDDPDLLAQVYRAVHTIKGTCGFLGFGRLEALTHSGEDLLDALRSGKLALDADITTSLLRLIDVVRVVLDRIEATGDEGDDDNSEVIAALAGHLEGESARTTVPDRAVEVDPAAPVVEALPGAVTPLVQAQESSVRVDVGVLDNLMDLVGELVLTRGQIAHVAADDDEGPLRPAYRLLDRITTELQESVMRARLQPVGVVTGKFPRIARDLATSMGKRVRVELDGEEVGVDRAVNETLKEALLHLVRNAVDHGLETPDERIAAGKDPEGCLRIRASHAGGRVQVEISDDGRGVDPKRLAARAVSAGALTRGDADALTAHGALQLMFLPGLSTKDEVTTVSGRGVGMDAVRESLDQLGASIEVASEIGSGTVFRINVPLTLAILPSVLVWSGGQRYALPQIHVREVVHLEPDEVLRSVDDVDGVRIHRLRGRLLPLVAMSEQMRVSPTSLPGLTIVVVELDGRRFGITVDAVGDTVEAVVEPLTQATRSIAMFAGVTLLADGQAALIVNLDELAAAAGLVTTRVDAAAPAEAPATTQERSLLLATAAGGARVAVPLAAVVRLEHFPGERVQRSRGGDVIDYGDAILPLLPASQVLAGLGAGEHASLGRAEYVPTIVCRSSAGSVGLVVERIDDVVAEPARSSSDASEPSVGRRVVIDDTVTELIDIDALIATAEGRGPK
jgi:two-component system chemotaxis sensor kinase CheA